MTEEAKPTFNSKPFWLSKTVWFNALVFAASFFPQVQVLLQAHPEALMAVIAGANWALRHISHEKVSLW